MYSDPECDGQSNSPAAKKRLGGFKSEKVDLLMNECLSSGRAAV